MHIMYTCMYIHTYTHICVCVLNLYYWILCPSVYCDWGECPTRPTFVMALLTGESAPCDPPLLWLCSWVCNCIYSYRNSFSNYSCQTNFSFFYNYIQQILYEEQFIDITLHSIYLMKGPTAYEMPFYWRLTKKGLHCNTWSFNLEQGHDNKM
jgi:hypothetical protein